MTPPALPDWPAMQAEAARVIAAQDKPRNIEPWSRYIARLREGKRED